MINGQARSEDLYPNAGLETLPKLSIASDAGGSITIATVGKGDPCCLFVVADGPFLAATPGVPSQSDAPSWPANTPVPFSVNGQAVMYFNRPTGAGTVVLRFALTTRRANAS